MHNAPLPGIDQRCAPLEDRQPSLRLTSICFAPVNDGNVFFHGVDLYYDDRLWWKGQITVGL